MFGVPSVRLAGSAGAGSALPRRLLDGPNPRARHPVQNL